MKLRSEPEVTANVSCTWPGEHVTSVAFPKSNCIVLSGSAQTTSWFSFVFHMASLGLWHSPRREGELEVSG